MRLTAKFGVKPFSKGLQGCWGQSPQGLWPLPSHHYIFRVAPNVLQPVKGALLLIEQMHQHIAEVQQYPCAAAVSSE